MEDCRRGLEERGVRQCGGKLADALGGYHDQKVRPMPRPHGVVIATIPALLSAVPEGSSDSDVVMVESGCKD